MAQPSPAVLLLLIVAVYGGGGLLPLAEGGWPGGANPWPGVAQRPTPKPTPMPKPMHVLSNNLAVTAIDHNTFTFNISITATAAAKPLLPEKAAGEGVQQQKHGDNGSGDTKNNEEEDLERDLKHFFSAQSPLRSAAEQAGFNCVVACEEKSGLRQLKLDANTALEDIWKTPINCSKEIDEIGCVKKCQQQQPQSSFANYIRAVAAESLAYLCRGGDGGGDDLHRGVVNMGDTVLGRCEGRRFTPEMVSELVAKTKTTFMQAFAAAAGDPEKRCRSLIDQWVNQFSTQFCAADRSGTVASAAARAMVRLLAGKLLAFTTNGSMIEKCPQLYTVLLEEY